MITIENQEVRFNLKVLENMHISK